MTEKKSQTDTFIIYLQDLFKKAPHIPAHGREVIVSIMPLIALIFGILGVIASVIALGASPLALLGGLQSSVIVIIAGISGIISSVLLLMAYPKLKPHLYQGWVFLFWAEIVGAVSSILSISLASVIGSIIGLYLLFEIKSYYLKK
jgi:hypothetical protein